MAITIQACMETARAYSRQIASTQSVSHSIPSILGRPDILDAWWHQRMYSIISPLVSIARNDSWLTIGDSGADAAWLKSQGIKTLTSSSIAIDQIKQMQELGYLDGIHIAAVNAESITFSDESIDIVLCKEAYHHFPRPAIGLYEMIRVSRKAVVLLTEPNGTDRVPIFDRVRNFIKRSLRKGTLYENQEFEVSGNFIYRLSLEELYRASAALQLGPIYYRYTSAFWTPQVSKNPREHWFGRAVIIAGELVQDLFSTIGLMSWGRLTAIVFKGPVSTEDDRVLVQGGFRKRAIPKNPFI